MFKYCFSCKDKLTENNTPKCIFCDDFCNDNNNNYCKDRECCMNNNLSIVRNMSKYIKDCKELNCIACDYCYKVFVELEDPNLQTFILYSAVKMCIENNNYCNDSDDDNDELEFDYEVDEDKEDMDNEEYEKYFGLN